MSKKMGLSIIVNIKKKCYTKLIKLIYERGLNMRTVNRYFIHFGGIGTIFLIGAIGFIIADGGELLNPFSLTILTFADMLFVGGMTLFFSRWEMPTKVCLKAHEDIVKEIEKIALKKWGRKTVIHEENVTKFIFDNKYKDWLATSVELVEEDNCYSIYLPSIYVEDLGHVCNKSPLY